GLTALLEAACKNSEEICKALICQGADPNMPSGPYSQTPLLVAAFYNSCDAARVLLISKADPSILSGEDSQSPLQEAVINNSYETAQVLLLHKADPNLISGEHSLTPLLAAALMGNMQFCQLLLDHNADSNATDNYGQHIIWLAAQNGHRSVIELLIERGGDPQQKVKFNGRLRTAAWNARDEGFKDLGNWLDQQKRKQ
ncbi:unnamed protein product, partial [Meganyctiphanes norvegica]